MKNKIFGLILTLFFLVPAVAVAGNVNSSQSTTKTFIVGSIAGASLGDWDPPIYMSLGNNDYIAGTLEGLLWADSNGDVHPWLATNYTIYSRPDEGGHSGGIKAIAFSLREDVKFHDGSDWNATVAKWNLDRLTSISGNLTGTGDAQNRDFYWIDTAQYSAFFTAHWNLTWAEDNYFGLGTEIPIMNNTEIINDHLINVTFNTWSLGLGTFAGPQYNMISMHSYSPWTDEPMYGSGENPSFPQDNPAIYPGHMIGTGPYIFDYFDPAVTSTGHLNKNQNYWNKTALEADGLFSITDVYLRHYADVESRTTALLTGEIDYCYDQSQGPITDHQAVIDDPLLKYVPSFLDSGIISVTFKSLEGWKNTPCAGYGPYTPKVIYENIVAPGTTTSDGVNRTVRRALSYSFDYVTYFDIVQDGWGTPTYSALGRDSVLLNDSIPAPSYNLTKAREILLSDPYYAGLAAARGLTASNTTQQWVSVATSNPIGTHNMVYTTGTNIDTYMEAALNKIGFGFVGIEDPNIWVNQVGTGAVVKYDMFGPFVWPQGRIDCWAAFNVYYTSMNRVIPYKGYNFNFMANASIDSLFMQIYFSGNKQPLWDQLQDSLQNYHVPNLNLGQYQCGFGINKGWNFTSGYIDRTAGRPYYPLFYGNRDTGTEIPPFIPGYEPTIITAVSLITVFGLIFIVMKRRRSFN